MKTSSGGVELEGLSFEVLPQPKQVQRCLRSREGASTDQYGYHVFHATFSADRGTLAPRPGVPVPFSPQKAIVFLSIILFIPFQLVFPTVY